MKNKLSSKYTSYLLILIVFFLLLLNYSIKEAFFNGRYTMYENILHSEQRRVLDMQNNYRNHKQCFAKSVDELIADTTVLSSYNFSIIGNFSFFSPNCDSLVLVAKNQLDSVVVGKNYSISITQRVIKE